MARPVPHSSSGNAFIYVLLAVILLGGLTYVLSKNSDNNPGSELDAAGAQAAATSILAYASQAQSAVEGMMASGVDAGSIDFTMPSDAAFNTGDTTKKLFHPDGGGLQLKTLPRNAIGRVVNSPVNSYYAGRYNNFEWTPTPAQDVIFSAYGISLAVCQQLQLKVAGTTNIPGTATGLPKAYFVDGVISGTTNADFSAAICSNCNGQPASCVRNGAISSTSTLYTFYSILVAR